MKQEKITELEKLIQEEYGNIAGMVVLKGGQVCHEGYFNHCTAASRLHVYSVTKSIISLLFGIAMDKGLIKNLDEKIVDFFPNYAVPKGEETLQQVTLRHLLTMTAPYKFDSEPYTEYFTSDDWVTFALDSLGGEGQMGSFRYAPLVGPDILSGILTKTTGQSVLDFARENLFSPLGITIKSDIIFRSKEEQMAFYEATDISGWVADSKGVNAAGWGLTLTAMDMARIGQLCLNKGKWQGNQIVAPEWIAASTAEHSRWKELNLAYGYLWWVIDAREHSFAAMGDGGNVIYVNPEKSLVIAIAAFFRPEVKDSIALIKEHIEPLFA